jgi:FtsX-like permease family
VGRRIQARQSTVEYRDALRVVWYRCRVVFSARVHGYLVLVVLIGLLGGLAIGAMTVARRTQSSFSRFLSSTHASQLTATTFTNGSYDAKVVHKVSRLPGVRHVESAADLDIAPLGPDGEPEASALRASFKVLSYGSVDGLYFDQDRVTVTDGRMSDPQRADEVVLTRAAAQLLHLRVGEVTRVGVYANTGQGLSRRGAPSAEPYLRTKVKVVGLVVFNDAVVRDDAFRFPTYVLFTPAFTRPLTGCCAFATVSGIQVEARSVNESALETAIEEVLPKGSTFYFRAASIVTAQVERATRPEAVALGVFGAISAVAALVIASQVIGRLVRAGSEDLVVLRALGASPSMTSADGLIGTIGAVATGSLLAAAVGIGVSSLGPLGPIRAMDPGAGTTFDWTVVSVGTVALIVVLSAVAVVYGYRQAPHRTRRPSDLVTANSAVWRSAAAGSLPFTAIQGTHFALESKRHRNPVPARSTVVSAAVAIVLVVATLVFGASLSRLVSRPALYGWNWDYELSSQFGGSGNIPLQQATRLLDREREIQAWTGVYFDTMRIDHRTVPVLGTSPRAAVGPPILSGHALEAQDQVVLGATTLAQLHKHLGDVVEARYATVSQPTRLRIVGTATMPAVGPGGGLHLSMGAGAILTDHLIPFDVRNGGGSAIGPNAIFVRLRNHAAPASARHSIEQIATALNTRANGTVSVLTTQRPAEIVNYRSIGTTPAILGAALAAGAATALALTLAASVRSRRRDLALFKALGLTRHQVSAVVGWQATAIVVLGTLIGVPVGIVIGRTLWGLFAHALHVVPASHVPTASIVLVALGAVLLANLVATLPARQAARTPVALLLREE